MGKNNRKLVLKVRYRKPHKVFGTRLILSSNSRRNKRAKGRILFSRKLSFEEINKVGEFAYKAFNFDDELPASLMDSKYKQEVKSNA